MKKTKEELKKHYEINEGHYFEVMDRAYTICEMLETLIGGHPLLKCEKSLQKTYNKAIQAVSDLYQEAGHLEYVNSDDYVDISKVDKNEHLRPIVKDMPDDYEMDN